MPATMTKGRVPMEMKKLSISAKRQITIPQKFFTMLGFDTEAECTVRGNELVIRPVRTNAGGEFADIAAMIFWSVLKRRRGRCVQLWKQCLWTQSRLHLQNLVIYLMRMFLVRRMRNDRGTFSSACSETYQKA